MTLTGGRSRLHTVSRGSTRCVGRPFRARENAQEPVSSKVVRLRRATFCSGASGSKGLVDGGSSSTSSRVTSLRPLNPTPEPEPEPAAMGLRLADVLVVLAFAFVFALVVVLVLLVERAAFFLRDCHHARNG